MTETVLDMIRHGEPVGGKVYRGHGVDDALSEKGWSQMWQAVREPVSWEVLVSSPMRRCSEFAAALAEKYSIPFTIEDDLREVGFGEWEGKRAAQIEAETPGALAAFYADPVNCRPREAEPLDDFIKRVAGVFDKTLQAYPGKRILWVAHAGVMRAAITHVLGAEPASMYRMTISNAAIARIRLGKYGAMLESLA